jgi:hypothetical protein
MCKAMSKASEQGYEEIKNWKYKNWGWLILINVVLMS